MPYIKIDDNLKESLPPTILRRLEEFNNFWDKQTNTKEVTNYGNNTTISKEE